MGVKVLLVMSAHIIWLNYLIPNLDSFDENFSAQKGQQHATGAKVLEQGI